MDWLTGLLAHLAPLYLIAILGFVVGKSFAIDVKSITTMTIFVISPIVFMLSIARLEFTPSTLIAPVLLYCLACGMAVLVQKVTSLYLPQKTSYLAAHSAGTSNCGYFGIPIAFALFPPDMVAVYILTSMALNFFEATFGMYLISRGHKSMRESFLTMFRYPVIYAAITGVCLSAAQVSLPNYAIEFLGLFKGAYTVLGMMIIGLGLSRIEKLSFDWRFLASMTVLRFVVWPALALAVVSIDQHLHILGDIVHKPLLLLSLMPMAANNIAYATQFDMHPEKAATGVLFTTVFAIVYLPVAIYLLGLS